MSKTNVSSSGSRILRVLKALRGHALNGISNGGISQIENGKAMPGGEFLLKMHQEFNVDVNWLLTGMSTDGMT
ncbi:helix-turn-helix domain-containing protein, partial [Escherichia coli]|uniref:helix-turn-helix domain-containing protein n=1 Tax=Escherichia coli TaxID=562 RepID=UPI003EE3FF93